jgi:hypothetical protein
MREGTLTTLGVVTLAAAALFIAPSWVSDLGPPPDALEYAVTARRLAHGESFRLLLLSQEVPSQYPFGFPAYLAPASRLLGGTLASGIYGVLLAGVAVVALRRRTLIPHPALRSGAPRAAHLSFAGALP